MPLEDIRDEKIRLVDINLIILIIVVNKKYKQKNAKMSRYKIGDY